MSHHVVINEEGKYSTWAEGLPLPTGWEPTGFVGSQDECLDHIAEVWTNLGPPRPVPANVLETERCVLRELSPAEVRHVLAVLDDGAAPESHVPGYPLVGTGFAARHFTSRSLEEITPGFGMYYLREKDSGLAFGDMGFHRPPVDGAAEVGFGLAESHRGRGYATGALVKLTDWAFTQPGLERIIATTTDDNVGAQGVLARSGFRYDHTEDNVLHYVLRAPVGTFPRFEAMRDDDIERAALAKLGRIRKAGGDDLEFVPGSEPLRRVLRDGERLLAYAQSGDKHAVDDPDNHLMFIVVHPAASRQGLATALLEEVVDHARSRGKHGLITGTPDDDAPSIAWVRKNGYELIGHHRITRRQREAPLPDGRSGLDVHALDRTNAQEVTDALDLAETTIAEAIMPGGARMVVDADQLHRELVEDDGPLLICRSDGRACGWAKLSPLHCDEDGMVQVLHVRNDAAGTGVAAALLRAAAELADASEVTALGAVVEPAGQPELAEALPAHGFVPVGGRTIWRRPVDPS